MSHHAFTLGASLAAPMVPETNPSILPWQVMRYDLSWRQDGQYFTGSATQYIYHPESIRGFRWHATCFGPGDARMEATWHATAEAARAAVEEHIAAHIETHLTEEAHAHEWVDLTTVDSLVRRFVCAGCGERKDEPR